MELGENEAVSNISLPLLAQKAFLIFQDAEHFLIACLWKKSRFFFANIMHLNIVLNSVELADIKHVLSFVGGPCGVCWFVAFPAFGTCFVYQNQALALIIRELIIIIWLIGLINNIAVNFAGLINNIALNLIGLINNRAVSLVDPEHSRYAYQQACFFEWSLTYLLKTITMIACGFHPTWIFMVEWKIV